MLLKSLLLSIMTMGLISTSALAAQVPAGTELAEVQEIVLGNGAEPGSLDPNKIEGVPGANIAGDLFEPLVVQDQEGKIVPGVAVSWKASDGNKVWTFKLRRDAKWSNGEGVTAHDFVYSWRRSVDPNTASAYAWYLELTEMANAAKIVAGEADPSTLGVRAIDDFTLEVTLDQPLPYFIKMLANITLAPLHRETVEKFGARWTRPGNMVSNGAYQLVEWIVNEKMVLKRNPHYWNDAETVIDQVTFVPIENANAELKRYQAGELDITSRIPVEHISKLQREIPAEVKISPRLGTYYYAFNLSRKPFDDVRVRRALALAIDRDVIVNHITKGGQLPAYTFTPEITDGFTPDIPTWGTWTQKQRDAEAKRLFAEAGLGAGNPLEFELLYNTSEGHKKVALAIAAMWKQKLGHVRVKLNNQEWKTYLDTTNQGNFTVARKGWVGDYNEASTMLNLGLSTHGNNDGRFASAEYDAIMAETRTTLDDAKRAELYNRAEAILAAEMPFLPIYQYTDTRLVKPHVGGYSTSNPSGINYRRHLYIIKR